MTSKEFADFLVNNIHKAPMYNILGMLEQKTIGGEKVYTNEKYREALTNFKETCEEIYTKSIEVGNVVFAGITKEILNKLPRVKYFEFLKIDLLVRLKEAS